jgi:hypothetical protein
MVLIPSPSGLFRKLNNSTASCRLDVLIPSPSGLFRKQDEAVTLYHGGPSSFRVESNSENRWSS